MSINIPLETITKLLLEQSNCPELIQISDWIDNKDSTSYKRCILSMNHTYYEIYISRKFVPDSEGSKTGSFTYPHEQKKFLVAEKVVAECYKNSQGQRLVRYVKEK